MMNPLIPFFVAVPLAGAFLTMILGRFTTHISKYLATVVLLFTHLYQLLVTFYHR